MNKKIKLIIGGLSAISTAAIISSSIIIPININKESNFVIVDELSSNSGKTQLNTNDIIKNQYSSEKEPINEVTNNEDYSTYNNNQNFATINKSWPNISTKQTEDMKIENNLESNEESKNESILDLWDEFEGSLNVSKCSFIYTKSQRETKNEISEVKILDSDGKVLDLSSSANLEKYNYFINNTNILFEDIVNIYNGKLDDLQSYSLDEKYWDLINSGFHGIREKLFVELSKSYKNQKDIIADIESLNNKVDFFSKKLTGHSLESIIMAPSRIQEEIQGVKDVKIGLFSDSLFKGNKQHEIVWPLISEFLNLISEQFFYQDLSKEQLDSVDLSKVMFANLINSAAPVIIDFFITSYNSNKEETIIEPSVKSLDSNPSTIEDTDNNSLSVQEISKYIAFVYKLINGKATYLDIQEIIPSDLIKGLPQSFYGIAFNALQTLTGNPFKESGFDLYDINLSIIQRLFTVIDLVTAIVDINSFLDNNGYVNLSYFSNWIKDEQEDIMNQKDSKIKLSNSILPIVDKLNKFLSYRLELANYDEQAQKQALNVFIDTTFQTLSEFNLIDYNKDDNLRPVPGTNETVSYINKIEDQKIKNVLNDTFVFIKNLDTNIYSSDMSKELLKVNYYSNKKLEEESISNSCNNIIDNNYSNCFNYMYKRLENLAIHTDDVSNSNIKFAKANIKAYAMNKINMLDSAYNLTYDDIWDEAGNKKSYIENLIAKKNNLMLNIFAIIYGNNSKYYDSYKTMTEGINILPGTNYRSVVPLASAAFLSFDNTIPAEELKIDGLIESYKPLIDLVIGFLKNLMENDKVLGTLLSSVLDMMVGALRPSELITKLSSVLPDVPAIPEWIINLVSGGFEDWLKSQNGYLNRFKGIFREIAKLLTFKNKVKIPFEYFYKAEQAFSSAGLYNYLNIGATYNREEKGFSWGVSVSDIYTSTKYDPFTMLDNYVIDRIVNTTSISREDASKVLEDILYQAIGEGLGKTIPGYSRPVFSSQLTELI